MKAFQVLVRPLLMIWQDLAQLPPFLTVPGEGRVQQKATVP